MCLGSHAITRIFLGTLNIKFSDNIVKPFHPRAHPPWGVSESFDSLAWASLADNISMAYDRFACQLPTLIGFVFAGQAVFLAMNIIPDRGHFLTVS